MKTAIGRLKGLLACVSLCAGIAASPGLADTWRGTAPFCEGECLPGEREIARSSHGDGAYCLTGSKALCTNSSQMCQATATRAECYGVVMVCENGRTEPLTDVWHACNSYGCGVCIGFGEGGVRLLNSGSAGGSAGWAPVPCAQGYVWREAYAGDYVCVKPESRARAQQDNRQTAARKVAGSDSCLSGFVWREAVPSDRVCVEPQTRSETWEENRLAASRLQPARRVADHTCKAGFVWREAVAGDYVCVPPATRQQAWDDNAQAGQRVIPGSDRCKPGFVWREVLPGDHVCVLPATRSASSADNAMAPQRVARR